MVAHEKRNSGQLFCTVPTRNDLTLSSLIFSAQPTQKLGYPPFRRARGWLDSKRASLWEALLNARVRYSARKNSGFRSRRPSSAAAICASSAFRSPFSVPFSVR